MSADKFPYLERKSRICLLNDLPVSFAPVLIKGVPRYVIASQVDLTKSFYDTFAITSWLMRRKRHASDLLTIIEENAGKNTYSLRYDIDLLSLHVKFPRNFP